MEGHSFRIVLRESPGTMQKLCLSTKFTHQETRWNYSISRSDCFGLYTKIKERSGISFRYKFLYTFSIKMFLIWYSINWLSFNIMPSFSRYQVISVFKVFFHQLVTPETLNLSSIISSNGRQVEQRKKGNTKNWIS